MAIQISSIARTAEADAHGALLNNGTVVYLTGAIPADESVPRTGVVVATFDLPATAYQSATDDGTNGTIAANPIPTTNATSDGTVTYYRAYRSGGADPADVIKQGTITGVSGGGDIEIDNPVITNGEPLSLGTWTYSRPRG